MLNTSPLSEKCFKKIFSQTSACVFNLLTLHFTEQVFILVKSNLLFFSFIDLAFGFQF